MYTWLSTYTNSQNTFFRNFPTYYVYVSQFSSDSYQIIFIVSFIKGTGYMLISYFFYRKPPTRVKDVSLVSFVVLCAATHGAVGTRGPTWDKSVSPATLWCTPTPSVPYEDQIHVRSDELAKWLCTELYYSCNYSFLSVTFSYKNTI